MLKGSQTLFKNKKEKVIEKLKIDVPCPSYKQRNWIKFDKGYYCKSC